MPLKYSVAFDVAVWEIFGPLIAGARLVIAPPGAQPDPDLFIRFLCEHGITVLDLVPSPLRALLEEPQFRSCASLRRVTCGSEPLDPGLRRAFFEQFDIELNNMYGPTEATITATWWTCSRTDPAHTAPIGRRIANTQAYVLDAGGNLLPVGVPGELYIGGDCLARGYLNRPELTRQLFVSNRFASHPDARLYKTGDLVGFLPQGALEYLGRVDEQVKVMIPHRSVTLIAAVSLPEELLARPRFSELAGHYAEEVFRKVGYPFDVRVCIKDFPLSQLISDAQVFEDLCFSGQLPLEQETRIELTVQREARLDGFLLWLNLYPAPGILINVLSEQHNWLPVYFPTFHPGVDVREGVVIRAVCSVIAPAGRFTPNYRLEGTVIRRD